MPQVTVSPDGDVALITLANPPLNLFGPDAFDELSDCIDEVAASDARAAVWRAEGEIFTGGVDVQVFADAVASGEGEDFPSLVGPIKRSRCRRSRYATGSA
jgi:enoyl-CoA hydratase/carnithine racemase